MDNVVHRRRLSLLAGIAALAGAYFATAWAGLQLALDHPSASVVWPAAGLAVGVLVARGTRLWPGVTLGAFAANVVVSGHVASSIAIALGNTGEAVLASWLVHRFAGGTRAFSSAQGWMRFVALAAVASTGLGATVGLAALMSLGLLGGVAPATVWFTWWMGDAVGVILIAPVIILFSARRNTLELEPAIGRHGVDVAALGLVLVALSFMAFAGMGPAQARLPFAFVTIPIAMWAAHQAGPRTASLFAVAVAGLAISGTIWGSGAFSAFPESRALAIAQFFSGVVALTAMAAATQGEAQRQLARAWSSYHRRLEQAVAQRTQKLQAAMREAEDNANALARAEATANLGSWEWDVPSNTVRWSDQLYAIFGLEPQSLPANYDQFLDLLHPEDRNGVDAIVRRAMITGEPFTLRHRVIRSDGTMVWVLGRGEVEVDDLGHPRRLRGTAQDITDEHRQQQRFRSLLEAAPDAAVISDHRGVIQLVNRQTEAMFGYERAELVGKPVEVLMPERMQDAHVKHRSSYMANAVHRPMGQGRELRARRKDGSEFPVEISLGPIETEEGLLVSASIRDITDRKRAEAQLEESRKRVNQSQRLASLGTLVAGVAHEIRTPLTYMRTHLHLANSTVDRWLKDSPDAAPATADIRRHVDAANDGALRINRLVEELRHFGKTERHDQTTHLADLVASAAEFAKSAHEGDVKLRIRLDAAPVITADAGQIEQVLMNLINNAYDVSPPGRSIEVRLSQSAGEGMVEILDHGPGIPEAAQPRIFDPFFTTKEHGTGLGLSLSRQIVENHGGRLEFETEPGQGTTFRVVLPVRPDTRPSQVDALQVRR